MLDGEAVCSRPSVYVRRFEKAPSPPPPNTTVEAVTVDLMVFYPPTSEGVEIARASLASAYLEAADELQARRPEERNT